jgi:CubicO group peptidase (beta-lactamase class C family)
MSIFQETSDGRGRHSLLAGMLIRAVTGHDWRQEVTARVIRPRGLRDTFAPGDRVGKACRHGVLWLTATSTAAGSCS